MKRPNLKMFLIASTLVTLIFQNCASKNFSAGVEANAQTASSTGGSNTSPGPVVLPNTPNSQAIKMTLATPDCPGYSTCTATFTLKQAQSVEVHFHWITDDTRYLQDASRYARPNVNYTPTEGDLIFVPGQVSKLIYIQSLAMSGVLKIPFRWHSCTGNGQPIACPEVEYLNPQ